MSLNLPVNLLRNEVYKQEGCDHRYIQICFTKRTSWIFRITKTKISQQELIWSSDCKNNFTSKLQYEQTHGLFWYQLIYCIYKILKIGNVACVWNVWEVKPLSTVPLYLMEFTNKFYSDQTHGFLLITHEISKWI